MGIPCSSQKLFREGQLLDHEAVSLKTFNNKMEAESSVIYVTFGDGDDDQVHEAEHISFIFEFEREDMMRLEFKVSISDESSNPLVSLFKIKLRSLCTILDLKAAIQSLTNCRICNQKLCCDDLILKDWETLVTCNITKWYIEGRFQLTPIWDTDKIFSADKTLYEVLDSMPEKRLESIGSQVSSGIVFYLIHTQCLLRLKLTLNSVVQINVTGPNGATTKVHVNPSYTFKDLKEKIELNCGIPYGVQRLTEDGAELNDDLTIRLYEEYYGSLWKLRWNFCGTSWSFFYPSYTDCSRIG